VTSRLFKRFLCRTALCVPSVYNILYYYVLTVKDEKAGLAKEKNGCGGDRNEKCFYLSSYLCIYRPFKESFDCVELACGHFPPSLFIIHCAYNNIILSPKIRNLKILYYIINTVFIYRSLYLKCETVKRIYITVNVTHVYTRSHHVGIIKIFIVVKISVAIQ
jgi:hypothetical protein